MSTFLLEIRTEEIPANALPGARRQLAELMGQRLREAGFEPTALKALSTSLRLALVVDGLPERQEDRSEEMTGPPVRVAVAEDGTPTKAGEGFARKAGVPFDQLQRLETARGEYLTATVVHQGRATVDILAEAVSAVIAALRFPKMMRWGVGRYFFVRPVHGLVALFDERIVAFDALGVSSGRTTVGHRVHAPEVFELATAEDYATALEARRVMVDPERRLAVLSERAANLASSVGLRVHEDPSLVAEHVELVEWPGLTLGAIDELYLELPPEVVVSTLRHHQKCLILEDESGLLKPQFLAVVDRDDDPKGLIRQGNEWVIGARLADAAFFFAEDRKTAFDALIPQLERVEWHRVMGSLAAKAERVGTLAGELSDRIGAGFNEDGLTHLASRAETDLVTNMVGEFPELQGIMGGHYLRLEGEAEAVWTAVRDHYVPTGFEGELPASTEGRLIGVADRLDTMAALFAVGEKPTGSKDPFGLRRAAQGLVKIVAESGWDVDLGGLVARAVHGVAGTVDAAGDEVSASVEAFLADRVRRYLVDVVEVAADTADAVMAADWSRLPDVVARARALEEVREAASFRALSLAFKRVRNITEGRPESEVDPKVFQQDEERELHEAVTVFHAALERLLPARRVAEAFAAMEPLAEVLDRFFVEVLVMAEDERVQANRIAILKTLGRDFLTLADLSKLQIEGGVS